MFLHGRAAAGKLTTARCLSLVGYPVFHSHLVVDLLTPMFPFGSPPSVRLASHCRLPRQDATPRYPDVDR